MTQQVLMYDVMIWQHWQVSLENEEGCFDWDKEVASINKEVWAYAEQRLPQTLQAAGLGASRAAQGGRPAGLQGGHESAEAAARRAEAAEAKVVAASRVFEEKRKMLLSQSGCNGGNGELSNTQRKKLE